MISLQTIIPGLGTSSATSADTTQVTKFASDIKELKSMSVDDLVDRLAHDLVNFAINLAVAILVFYVGRFVIRRIYRLVNTIFLRRGVDRSLSTFVLSLINIVLYFILIVTVIGILGIETTSFLALFASAGVAVGMALSGTLQNFAGGVLILLLKPYKIGDYIEAQGYAGTVREIQIFSTIINTYDNKSISIPNGGLSTGSVNNWSREAFRRVTWTVSISYGDSVDAAREAILAMFREDERIEDRFGHVDSDEEEDENAETTENEQNTADEKAPRPKWYQRLLHHQREVRERMAERERQTQERIAAITRRPDYSPKVFVAEMADSSVNLQVRAWTRTSLYWDVFYHYNERFYNELPQHGLSFPFPQLDVHMPRS